MAVPAGKMAAFDPAAPLGAWIVALSGAAAALTLSRRRFDEAGTALLRRIAIVLLTPIGVAVALSSIGAGAVNAIFTAYALFAVFPAALAWPPLNETSHARRDL